ncbi:unnamed protein product [Peronospora farinosa]|uniref:VPS9 domain-containing protein n=1 Tax=Peronospora farinosa TaxID=134698 RepID=A0AAV0USY8_9STRA|nr:unnamed protein product [Peronospora farinosa]CAI5739393.1 unnamed protein product [Peronospora farinosa]
MNRRADPTNLLCPVLDKVLHDEDCAELALELTAVDRLISGQCLVDHLQESTRRKRCRALVDLQDGNVQDPSESNNETLCYLSDVEESSECEDDSSADALIAAFGPDENESDERSNQIRDQMELRSKKLPRTSSASLRRVCLCKKERVSLASEDKTDAGRQEAFDSHNASQEYLDNHIRYAVVVRVVKVETIKGQTMFVLKVSDAETNMRWETKKTLKEMMLFYSHIEQISLVNAPVKKTFWGTLRGLRRFRLPKKLFAFRGSLNTQRRVAFDSFLRQTAALVAPAPLGPRRRKAVLLLQEFVGVPRHCDVIDRDGCTCFFLRNKLNASELVLKIFGAPEHNVTRVCQSFVLALTLKSLDDKHAFMPERKARTILSTVSRKMGEINTKMLKDDVLLGQLGAAHLERSEPDYDEFLDEVKHAVCGFVQERVLVPLEDHVHEALDTLTNWDDEIALKQKIEVLRTKPGSFFGVPPHIVAGSGSDWEDARRELRRVNEYALPLDKLKCLARAAGAIFQTCGSSCSSSSVDTTSLTSIEELDMVLRPSMTTDEFISVHLFVLVMSNMSQLLNTRKFLRVMCDPLNTTGELGYYLTTFEVAVDLLIRHADPQQPMLS